MVKRFLAGSHGGRGRQIKRTSIFPRAAHQVSWFYGMLAGEPAAAAFTGACGGKKRENPWQDA
jgi:hypothetical protein